MIFKSKKEKEMERKIRIRKAKSVVKRYISKLEGLQKRVFAQGKEYAKLGGGMMVRKQAAKYLSLEEKIRQAKKLLLLMEESEIQRELVDVSAHFIQFSEDIADSVAQAPKMKDMVKIHGKFEGAMDKVKEIEETLGTVLDATSEGILQTGEFSEEKIGEVTRLLEGEAAVDDSELDEAIDDKLKDIEDMMQK